MTETAKITKKNKWKLLRLSLKYRPKIMQLILRMRQCTRRRNAEIKYLKKLLKKLVEDADKKLSQELNLKNKYTETDNIAQLPKEFKDASSQTLDWNTNTVQAADIEKNDLIKELANKSGWNIGDCGDNEKSLAEQVKDVAQSALQQTGMVYVESAGMYYDYKTGYYYNTELGLYYHSDTGCYYYYSDEKQEFVFHSYPDMSAINTSLLAHQKKKAKKQLKRERKPEEDIDNLTKTLSQDMEHSKKSKRRKMKKNGSSVNGNKVKITTELKLSKESKQEDCKDFNDVLEKDCSESQDEMEVDSKQMEADRQSDVNKINTGEIEEGEVKEEGMKEKEAFQIELEDGECSDSPSEDEECPSNASTVSDSDEDAVAKHHPPCMRVIVKQTDLPKLKVGSLFLITKDGGTVGREGEHTILIRDTNVSRNHLEVRYDTSRRTYVATDLGSKNGTILNGNRMSESSEASMPMDVLHGSTIQLGETKLVCHIHAGNDTCGHCEPGLLMATEDKEKKTAYTRTCSVKKQHELELARLKNIYAPPPLAIEEKPYNDRAQARRETVGSSHHSAKTETTDLDTSISTENKGFKLLQKMGWSKGEGLGKDNQGDVEPVPLVSNEGKAGLGAVGAVAPPPTRGTFRPKNTIASATMRLATRTKMLQPPAKAFHVSDEDSD